MAITHLSGHKFSNRGSGQAIDRSLMAYQCLLIVSSQGSEFPLI